MQLTDHQREQLAKATSGGDVPARVDDVEKYWLDPPPSLSLRCCWWHARIRDGFTPNKRIRQMGYYELADYFGVYIWESNNILRPKF